MSSKKLIHLITNGVSREFVCDTLIAVGGSPIMTEYHQSFQYFFDKSDNLLINIGQLHEEKIKSSIHGAKLAADYELPWVVDLVGYAANPFLSNFVSQLLAYQPAVIKGNLSEVKAFLGLPALARGVDSEEGRLSRVEEQQLKVASQSYIGTSALILLATGPIDYIFSKDHALALENGSPLLGQVIGTGDANGALLALGAVSPGNRLDNLIQMTSRLNIASEEAERTVKNFSPFHRPVGTFKSLLLDALASEISWQEQMKTREI